MTNYCYDFFSYRNKKKLNTETQRHGEEKRIKAVLFEGKITEKIIESAIEVHRHLGPGLLESAYEECLCFELKRHDLSFERQKPLPLKYKSIRH